MNFGEGIEENAETSAKKYLTFAIADEEYGIEIDYVMEIIRIQKITELPDLPPYTKGVLNLRGKVIPVIDVRLRFGFEEKPYDDRTCVIVVQFEDVIVGLIVDSVNEVMDIPNELVSSPSRIRKGDESRFIQGLARTEKNVKILLNVEKILFDENVSVLESVPE